MSKTNLSPEVSSNTSSEISKQSLANKVFESLVKDKIVGEEILSKVKWSLGVQKRGRGDVIPWDPEAATQRISGNLRGFVAEEVSKLVAFSGAKTVFKSTDDITLENLKIASPQEFSHSHTNKKGDVLGYLLRKSLKEKPLRVFDSSIRMKNNPVVHRFKEERARNKSPNVPSQEYGRQLREYIRTVEGDTNDQIVQGYTYGPVREKDGSTTPAGEWYKNTVIPDSLIIDGDTPVGIVEVKAYQTDELGALLSLIRAGGKQAIRYKGTAADFGKTYTGAEKEHFNLGVDLNGEIDFVDIVRGLSGNGEERDVHNLVVLRFPSDIPDNLLVQYGEMISSYGYQNIVIQKLPFSNLELDTIAKEIVKSQWGNLSFQLLEGDNYSNRELSVLEKYYKGE